MKKITREDIVQAYYDLHHDYDHDKITMKLLSDKSGYSRRTIYNYFETKEELELYVYAIEKDSIVGVDFENKTAHENALIFCEDIENFRDVIQRFSKQPTLRNMWQEMCENLLEKQKTIHNSMLAGSIAAAINAAVIKYANDESYTIEDLTKVITQIIEPHIKK